MASLENKMEELVGGNVVIRHNGLRKKAIVSCANDHDQTVDLILEDGDEVNGFPLLLTFPDSSENEEAVSEDLETVHTHLESEKQNANKLFKSGRFEQAFQGYQEIIIRCNSLLNAHTSISIGSVVVVKKIRRESEKVEWKRATVACIDSKENTLDVIYEQDEKNESTDWQEETVSMDRVLSSWQEDLFPVIKLKFDCQLNSARACKDPNQAETAINFCTSAIQTDMRAHGCPTNWSCPAFFLRGNLFLHKDITRAVLNYRNAAKLNPDNEDVQHALRKAMQKKSKQRKQDRQLIRQLLTYMDGIDAIDMEGMEQ